MIYVGGQKCCAPGALVEDPRFEVGMGRWNWIGNGNLISLWNVTERFQFGYYQYSRNGKEHFYSCYGTGKEPKYVNRKMNFWNNDIKVRLKYIIINDISLEGSIHPCIVPRTVKHIIQECPAFNDIRKKIDLPQTFEEKLQDEDGTIQKIFVFLKLTRFYNRI